jgi:hypothetical protein
MTLSETPVPVEAATGAQTSPAECRDRHSAGALIQSSRLRRGAGSCRSLLEARLTTQVSQQIYAPADNSRAPAAVNRSQFVNGHFPQSDFVVGRSHGRRPSGHDGRRAVCRDSAASVGLFKRIMTSLAPRVVQPPSTVRSSSVVTARISVMFADIRVAFRGLWFAADCRVVTIQARTGVSCYGHIEVLPDVPRIIRQQPQAKSTRRSKKSTADRQTADVLAGQTV